jgi:hypothetical protein
MAAGVDRSHNVVVGLRMADSGIRVIKAGCGCELGEWALWHGRPIDVVAGRAVAGVPS